MEEKESKFELHILDDKNEKLVTKVDRFIMDKKTNGEFVNTIKYLSYHPTDRFVSDSIYVIDKGSKEIRGVMVAALDPYDDSCIVSHPGTSFAGPIVSRSLSITDAEEVIYMMLEYYESKYKKVVVRPKPEYFSLQPVEYVSYFLLRRGYGYSMVGLSNVVNISDVNSPEDVLSLYDSTKRNQTRKVLKSEKFFFGESAEIRDDSWANMNEVLSTKHNVNSVHTLEEIRQLKEMFPDNVGVYYANMSDGEYGASGIVYKYKDTFHTQYLDTNYSYTGEYPNLLVFYNLILEARKLGYKRFSIGISTEDNGEFLNYGLYKYKDGYGGGSIIQAKYIKEV